MGGWVADIENQKPACSFFFGFRGSSTSQKKKRALKSESAEERTGFYPQASESPKKQICFLSSSHISARTLDFLSSGKREREKIWKSIMQAGDIWVGTNDVTKTGKSLEANFE